MLSSKATGCLIFLRIHPKSLSRSVHTAANSVQTRTNRERQWKINDLQMQSCHDGAGNFYTGFIDTHLKSSVAQRVHARNILLLMNEADLDNNDALSEVQNNFLAPLSDLNCRVIIPFLPGSKKTKLTNPSGAFKNQLLGERTTFILDFLTTANIKKLDMVIGHSFACFPAFTLSATISSIPNLTLINPPSLHTSPKFILPYKKSVFMVELFERMYGRWLGRRMLRRVKSVVEACHYGSLTDDQAIHFIKTVQGVPYNMIESMTTSFNISPCNLLLISNSLTSASTSSSSSPSSNWKDEEQFLEFMGLFEIEDTHRLHNDAQNSESVSSLSPTSSSSSSPSQETKLRRQSLLLPSHEHFIFNNATLTQVIIDHIIHLLNKKTKS